jgi:hypothetical protein
MRESRFGRTADRDKKVDQHARPWRQVAARRTNDVGLLSLAGAMRQQPAEAAGADVIRHVWLQQPGDALAGQRRAVHHRGTAGPQGAGDLNIDRAVRTHEAPVIAARSRFVNDTTMRSEIRWPLRRAVLLQIGRSGYQGAAERGNRTGHG